MMSARALAGLAAAAVLAVAPQALAQSDEAALAAKGGQLFASELGCANCHFRDSTFAPPLAGVFDRKIGGVKGFLYSAALKSKGGKWTEANLDAFLASPQAFAPGTGTDASVSDPDQRKGVIAYLKTLKPPPQPSKQ